ncbi:MULTISPECIES: TM1266 family iron-only hydrogenase system putative regulator [Clostridium]|uniref:TM1266 family iron-only hydrogenase system putative regulator n=1 Tax=Clostridium lapidicellarium TaxID=3240931 RepID=A0ABV4DYH8_9CLOT|nr:TM1266 family iron-only hydrogenase system putative regulator [uncultured Clostridium sp.]
METRVAIIAIIAESRESADQINTLLHEYGSYIIGRMGLPYRKRGINIISIVVDAPQDKINTMAGKIGRIKGVTAKTVYSNVMN